MTTKPDPFAGKTNAECISLLEEAINRCKNGNKQFHTNFQTELDVLIAETDRHIAAASHFLALIKSFKNVAQQIEDRENSNLEWSKAQRENFLKMKQAENFSYRSNLEITILNRELTRRPREAPPEYDPASIPSTSGMSIPEISSGSLTQPSIDLSLSANTEDALLKSTSSVGTSRTEIEPPSDVDSQLSESAEIRGIQKIPLPEIKETNSTIPIPPPLPEGDASLRTQERYHLRPFSVILEEKAEEVKQKRRTKRPASSQLGSEEHKVCRLCSKKSRCNKKPLYNKKSPIPKIKINIKSLTKVDNNVTEQMMKEFETKEELLAKFNIVPREIRHSERLRSKLPREKEVITSFK